MDQQATGSQGSRPRSYTEGYKRQVIDPVVSTGRTAPSVAAEVGVHHTWMSRWVRQYGQPAGSAGAAALPPQLAVAASLKPAPVLRADQAAEIARLRRENERLRMERGILKSGSPSLRFRHDKVPLH